MEKREESQLELGEKLNILFKEKTGYKFDDMFSKYREKLKWFIMKMIKDEAEAEELADEAFVKAFFEIEKFDKDKGGFSTWLFTIGRNFTIQKIKNSSRFLSIDEEYKGKSGDSSEYSKVSDYLYADDDTGNFEKETVAIKKIQIVKDEINKMPAKYGNILIMREFDGLSYNDISDCLQMNLNTVKSRIKKAREILVERLEPRLKALDLELYDM
jgi:RNA polymerase sigma-70 factor (ECF subfamily)